MALACSFSCDADDVYSDDDLDLSKADLALPGRWTISGDALATANQHTFIYDNAGDQFGSEACPGGLRPGALALKNYLSDSVGGIQSIGGYDCIQIPNTDFLSMHATGRAIDIHIPPVNGGADNELGDPIANWLVTNAHDIGIQSIIWDRTVWNPSREVGQRQGYYSGNAHSDHIHVEINRASANENTPWFDSNWQPQTNEDSDPAPPLPGQGGSTTPEDTPPPLLESRIVVPEGCAPLRERGGTIDNLDGCLDLSGPMKFWRYEEDLGLNQQGFAWTHAFQSGQHATAASWFVQLPYDAEMAIEVYIPQLFGKHEHTRYTITGNSGTVERIIDQSSAPADRWLLLGTHRLDAVTQIQVFDNSDRPIETGTSIAVDALRVFRPGSRPVSEIPPEANPVLTTKNGFSGSGCQATESHSKTTLVLLFGLLLLALKRRLTTLD